MKKNNVREVALDLINRIEKDASYSHLIISDAIKRSDVSSKDEGLLTEIVYGTVNWQITIDYYLEDYLIKQKDLRNWVINLLRLSVYQMAFLDRVPTFAIINEAVMIAKKRGHKGIASLVNAVLRNIDRNGLKNTAEIEDDSLRLAIETSHPQALVERWVAQYGLDITSRICKENQAVKAMTLRVNLNNTSLEAVCQTLDKYEITYEKVAFLPQALRITHGNVLKTNLITRGHVTIQDLSSMLAAEMLDVRPGMAVLDTCAAPGGKTTYMAEQMNQTGTVYAFDLHAKKVKLIDQNARRLGLKNIQAEAKDARHLDQAFEQNFFDRILTDVPCSGLGVIRSKPDIKYSKTLADIERLSDIQYNILDKNAKLLKKDGKLIYSTCTIEQKENEDVIERFLNNHEAFEVDKNFLNHMASFENVIVTDYGVQIFPHTFHSDGFFIARLKFKDS